MCTRSLKIRPTFQTNITVIGSIIVPEAYHCHEFFDAVIRNSIGIVSSRVGAVHKIGPKKHLRNCLEDIYIPSMMRFCYWQRFPSEFHRE